MGIEGGGDGVYVGMEVSVERGVCLFACEWVHVHVLIV